LVLKTILSIVMGEWGVGGHRFPCVRQWISSVLGIENPVLIALPMVLISEAEFWRRRIFCLVDFEATMMVRSSTYQKVNRRVPKR
jgi:hypothetical protein